MAILARMRRMLCVGSSNWDLLSCGTETPNFSPASGLSMSPLTAQAVKVTLETAASLHIYQPLVIMTTKQECFALNLEGVSHAWREIRDCIVHDIVPFGCFSVMFLIMSRAIKQLITGVLIS